MEVYLEGVEDTVTCMRGGQRGRLRTGLPRSTSRSRSGQGSRPPWVGICPAFGPRALGRPIRTGAAQRMLGAGRGAGGG